MKAIKKRTIQDVIKGEKIHLEDILIGDKKFTLDAINDGFNSNHGVLILSFNYGEYTMRIEEGGVSFERDAYRPNHHPDSQILQIRSEDNKPESEEEKILWSSDYPYKGFGYEHYKIPFGSVKVDY